ncbi:arylsulfatase [Novosphingobium flavum]|uniref:Arylsulfatase n=1 Tax=Novosphingobium flavum TaxID=1778672 RepID=A0A7X1FRM1_9SPHN|nr:arylsulfatase [Novosphingobium flavum]MBC2665691.1 arylsulfatase [Novosphingobium flavum]
MKPIIKALCATLVATTSSVSLAAPQAPARQQPNIVVIVADDLGFSDLGAFGGEIRTPNLDALARRGLRLTNFHAAPTCSPTRSMLLSGTDNHTAGVGAMAETRVLSGDPNFPSGWGYEGVLTNRVATLAERLRAGGYFTTMAGKWHLGVKPPQDPHARGFDTSFALLQGGGNHFGGGKGPEDDPSSRANYTENGVEVGTPANFYSSNTYTSKLLAQLAARPRNKPFFAYLTYTAPHSPLQALPEDIARYKGKYDGGWAALRRQRLERMKALGIVAKNTIPAPLADDEEWNKLTPEQKKIESRKMEIYAAMVDRMDQNVGRLIANLKKDGAYKNTLFFFLSDNGPAGEGPELFANLPVMANFIASSDNSYASMGSRKSMIFYGKNWAQAGSAPYRLYKNTTAEGGTRVAAFVTAPTLLKRRGFGRAFATVMDVVPTMLQLASIKTSNVVENHAVAPIRGKSMLPYFDNKAPRVHSADETISFELHGQRAVWQGSWKLLRLQPPLGNATWALYNLDLDPAEQRDLSGQYPERATLMAKAWEAYAREAQVAH